MKGTIFLTVSALLYTVVTTFIFYKKNKVNRIENRIYKKLLIVTILSMVTELLIVPFNSTPPFNTIIPKTFFTCIILWLMIFFMYTIVITLFKEGTSEEENLKKFRTASYVFIIINIIVCILMLALPMEYISVKDSKYITGPAVNVLFVTLGLYVTFMIILVLTHLKMIRKKVYIPIIVLIILLLLLGVIQKSHPELLLSNAVFGFIIYLMYHTIENPDIKTIDELTLLKYIAEERTVKSKDDFLASMSHEIRTPLNAIVGLSEDIQSHIEDANPEIVEDAKYIMEASDRLLEIIGNILDINMIQNNKMEIVEVKYNFKQELEKLIKADSRRIDDKDINLIVNISPDIPDELIGDRIHTIEIINNLLTNAIKYTDQGEVELKVDCINKNNICNLTIQVRDTGRGISEDRIPELFTKFNRLEEDKDTDIQGTGLGLVITKTLVEMMNGQIDVQSTIGVGSTFKVQLSQKININNNENVEEL